MTPGAGAAGAGADEGAAMGRKHEQRPGRGVRVGNICLYVLPVQNRSCD